MVKDPIANLIISLKNAGMAGLPKVVTSYSRLKKASMDVLKSNGFVANVSESGSGIERVIEIELAYHDVGLPKIRDVRRVSKFSARSYVKASDIKPVKGGFGIAVISTPQGVLSGDAAQKANVGGEVLFQVW